MRCGLSDVFVAAVSPPCRIAARKCRAKKNALMTDLQATLAGLMRKNEEYKLQVG
jgi:hypothetical protein